jgi:hypothetical protein
MKMNKQMKTTMSLAAAMGCLATSSASAATSLIHHWALDGNANDSTGSDNGTATGGPSYVAGKFGQAVSLDGSTQYITTGTDPFPTTDFTLTAWLQQTSADSRYWAIGTQANPDGIHVWQNTNLRVRRLGGGEVDSGSALALNKWVHVAVTVSSTAGMTLFVDGVSQGTDVATTSQSSEANFTLGKRPDSNGDYFPGLIDDVAIFDGVLDSTQLINVRTLGATNFAVPEPTTTALLGLGGLALILRRRK